MREYDGSHKESGEQLDTHGIHPYNPDDIESGAMSQQSIAIIPNSARDDGEVDSMLHNIVDKAQQSPVRASTSYSKAKLNASNSGFKIEQKKPDTRNSLIKNAKKVAESAKWSQK